MAENLKTTKYNDGTPIPNVTDNTAWAALTTPAYCWYNNDATTYKATYGALYNWYVVNAANNVGKNVCPTGWHVPTDTEWHTLVLYLDAIALFSNTESLIAGGKLKETGTTHWESPNTGATNKSGFTALPGGERNFAGAFDISGSNSIFFHSNGCWWSSTEQYDFNAYYRRLYNSLNELYSSLAVKQFGYTVRCLKDN
jgi:uncharacterized protein (TIGR02145 family)